jgi:CRP-like cAMP-binding protein
MAVAVSETDAQDLRRLIPLNMLSGDRFEQLCNEVTIEDAPRGSVLFSKGDTKSEFVYVLKGTISLQADGMEMETITGGTESSRFALAHQIPRKVSAVAKDKVRFVRVESAFVNQSSTPIEARKANYEVREVREEREDDWVTTLLSSPIFQRLSPANLQQLLRNLEEISVKAGEQIIHQDDPGDYYYIIKQGRCALSRKPSKNSREIKLAELKTCDTFGEDSLISDQPRNVTVTMVTNGSLLRLNKANFLRLVKEPVISYVDYPAAQGLINNGARWLDVRPQDEFAKGHLANSINIPFFMLRMELGNLNRERSYVLVCETGRVSEAAAFLLIRNSFDAFVLRSGLTSLSNRNTMLTQEGAAPSEQPLPLTPSSELTLADLDAFSSLTSSESLIASDDSFALDTGPDSVIEAGLLESSLISDSHLDEASIALKSETGEQLAERAKADETSALAQHEAAQAQARQRAIPQQAPNEQARLAAEARVRQLETQVAELSSVVEEFVAQQQANDDDEVQSIRAELEMVRSQATADVMSLQTKLRAAEQEVSRLKHELDGTYAQVLQLQSGVDVSGIARNARRGWNQATTAILVGIVAFILGMVLILTMVRSTDFGKALLTQDSEQATTTPLQRVSNRTTLFSRADSLQS